jgi:hypothetical protein
MIETYYTRSRDALGWNALAWRFYTLALATSFFVMIEPGLTDLLFFLGVPCLALAGLKPARLFGPVEVLGIILFIWFTFLSLIFSEYSFATSVRAAGIEVYMILIYVITAYWVRHYGDQAFRTIIFLLIFGGVCTSLVGILAWLDIMPNSDLFFRDSHRSRIKSTFKDPNVLGPYLVMPLLGALWAFVESERKQFWYLPLALIIGTCLFLTFSRGAWIHTLVTLLIFFIALLSYRKTAYRVTLVFFLVMGLGVVGVYLFADKLFGSVGDSYFGERLSLQSYDSDRFGHIYESLFHIMEHPFGIGPNQVAFHFGYEPHNTFVVFALNNGVLACLGFAFLYAAAAYRCLTKVLAQEDGWLKYAFVLATMCGLFILMNVVGSIHWRHLFVTMGLAYGDYRSNSFLNPPRIWRRVAA